MRKLEWDELIGRMRATVLALERSLTPEETQEARELIDVGEPGIAFELVCTQLDEHDAAVTPQLRESLEEVGTTLGLDPAYWKMLRVADESERPPSGHP